MKLIYHDSVTSEANIEKEIGVLPFSGDLVVSCNLRENIYKGISKIRLKVLF